MNSYGSRPGTPSSSEDIGQYLQDLATLPVLSRKAEQEVMQQILSAPDSAEADAARTRLVEAHLRLVVHLARHFQSFGVELADLVQEGNLALLEATRHFDPGSSASFTSFATRRVCWTLYQVVNAHLHEYHLLESDGEGIYPLRLRLHNAFARHPIDEQAPDFDLPEARMCSLHRLLEELERDTASAADLPSLYTFSSGEEAPEEHVLARERRCELMASFQTLPIWERLVLTHRYVLEGAHTLDAIGRLLGMTREQVHQLEQQGVQRLRHPRHTRLLRSLL